MPFSVDNPPEAASKYSPKCRRAFVHAFNSVYSDTKSDGKAMAAGHAAAQRCEGKRSSMSDVKFNIYSGLLKAYESDGVKRLKTTASSSIRDLAGDTMTLKALEKMAATARQNMTIFLNHKYQVPEDVLGSVEGTELKQATGDGIWDLDFDIRIEDSNPRALKTWEAIQNGTKLGASIGAKIPEGGAEYTKDGLLIDDVILLEASIVGIPANPRSFVHYAVKAYEAAESGEDEDTTLIDTEKAKVWVTVDTEDTAEGDAAADAGKAKPKADAKKDEEPEVAKSDEGGSEPDDDDHPVAGVGESNDETDNTDGPAEDEADEADESESKEAFASDVPATQEAPESTPESDGEVDESVFVGKSIEALRTTLKATTDELVETRKALAAETEKRVAAERERDEQKEYVRLASQFVERISALPIGRRAGFAGEVTAFRTKFANLYDAEVLKILEKNE